MNKKKTYNFSTELEDNPEELVKYLDLALEGANLGIWDWFLGDNSVKFDRRWAEMLGLEYDTLKMELNTWESRVHPDDIDQAYADIKAYMNGETEQYENIHRMKHVDGHWVYILDRGRFSDWDKDGNPTRFTGTHFDITTSERYRKKLSLLFEHSPFGYAFCDMNGSLLELNSRYEEITGYTFEELKKLSYWDITPKKFEADEAKQIESMEKTGRYGPYRKEYLRKDGQLIPVELNGVVIEDYDGVKGIWSTVEDISEKKMLESHLIHSSKLASIGTLAAGVGHEINNPLAIIKGLVGKIQRNNPENNELLKTVERIDVAVDRIAKIVVGLRTFSRLDNSNTDVFDVKSAINDVISITENILLNENIRVNVNISNNGPIFIKGNRGHLQQVFLNLISNAKDATRDCKERIITIETHINSDNASIAVGDNGSGIPEANLQKIFDPFFTTKNVNEGTGIGLSIAYNIVKEHSGEITVTSQPNKGTQFKITLPISKVSSKESAEPILPNAAHLNQQARASLSGTVMFIDDEEEFRELACEMLEDMGVEVHSFGNAEDALKCFKKSPEKFDVIISDMKMPKMDGATFLNIVRSLSVKQPKFVFVTGGVSIDLNDFDGKNAEAVDGYFYKPFNESDLYDLLKAFLDSKNNAKKKVA